MVSVGGGTITTLATGQYPVTFAVDSVKGAAPFERRPPVRPFTTVAHLNGARTC